MNKNVSSMHLATNRWGIKMTKRSRALTDSPKSAVLIAFAGVSPVFILFILFGFLSWGFQ